MHKFPGKAEVEGYCGNDQVEPSVCQIIGNHSHDEPITRNEAKNGNQAIDDSEDLEKNSSDARTPLYAASNATAPVIR